MSEKAAVYVQIGPLDSLEQAQALIESLKSLSAWGHATAAARLVPGNVASAVAQGLQHLCATPGHFQIRVDGGPEVGAARLAYTAEGSFKKPA